MLDHRVLLDRLLPLARRAGDAILEIYGREDLGVEWKEDASPLTAADLASNRLIVAGLAEITPDVPVIAEESRATPWAERRSWRRCWLVDPLDGTKEFISRNGEFTVNIALVEDGFPVLGVVYAPVLDRTYWGWSQAAAAGGTVHVPGTEASNPVLGATGRSAAVEAAEGASPATSPAAAVVPEPPAPARGEAWRRDGDGPAVAISVAGRPGAPLRVVASRSHRGAELDGFLARLPAHAAVSIGSSLKFCLLAEGAADLYPRFTPTHEWDTAAGDAVLRAGGGMVLTFENEPLSYNKEGLLNPYFVACTPATEHVW